MIMKYILKLFLEKANTDFLRLFINPLSSFLMFNENDLDLFVANSISTSVNDFKTAHTVE